jgi:glyoxylase-like metal-dependent hydrolase (beta-lactamase superfamily II)
MAHSIIQLAKNLFAVDEEGVRSYLLCGEKRLLLIDTGFGKINLRSVVNEISDLPVTVVNTHSDGDHTGCNALFEHILMHPAEFSRYAELNKNARAPEAIWEGDKIDIGGIAVECLLIPGHTPGSIALLDRENRRIFTGDTVSDGAIYMFGAGRNLTAFIHSLEKLNALTDCFDTVYAAHGTAELPADFLPLLLRDAKRLQAGELTGNKPPYAMPCKLYAGATGKFLY